MNPFVILLQRPRMLHRTRAGWRRVLAFESVSRRFGRRLALDGVSFRLDAGQLVALVGPNGAGKTTLLRLAATLDAPTSGRVTPDGIEARRRIGWLGGEPALYDDLTVRENLAFVASFFGHGAEVADAAARFGIAHRLDTRAGALSRGERQRAALARATLAGDLLLLDEPTTALDAEGADAALRALVELRGRRTMLVATHDAALVAKADRVLRLQEGRLA
ncbi:MAG: heme exporter protein [Thermoplasmata archaeon]|jgi:ABC-type multidrug transport system ATPase subunit|nr:heme exporter protein [Thermoplasmata archaeon]